MLLARLKRYFPIWWVPALAFLITSQDPFFARIFKLPEGTVATVIEVLLSALMIGVGRQILSQKDRFYLLIPAGLAVGDLIYGLSNYIFHWNFPNRLGCLLYVVPYMTAMILILKALLHLLHHAEKSQPRLSWIAAGLSLGVLILCFADVVSPAFFHKEPPLSPLLKTLTVLYTLIEGPIIGVTIALLLCASVGVLQIGLFGVLIMHVADMAIRYQSVRLDQMGMSVFEYGWAFSLALMFGALILAKAKRKQGGSFAYATWLPLTSIRGMTVGFVMAGFIVLWSALNLYYKTFTSASTSASTLLILVASFAFSLVVADFVTKQVLTVVLRLQGDDATGENSSSLFVPDEIKAITGHFEKLNSEISAEKDRVLTLTATVTHDLKGPITAVRNLLPLLEEGLGEECGCRTGVSEQLKALSACSEVMQRTADDLLSSRRTSNEGETIAEAVKKAATLVQLSHSQHPIVVDVPSEFSGPRMRGLTRVISNLITNAVEASPGQSPVHVAIRRRARGFEVSVRDRGVGIPRRVLESVERGQPITTKAGGNGLGLTSVISWAKKSGVRYRISPNPNGGTEVALTIPEAM